ncbi:unnamed protein product [Polarella glacialis]|uniref:Uncharacterized protein n=1 Tax=Polarella glacialis TaxID=89957 RepID=A0A813EWP7_POLGL|nr:unnamed protein product [Polarella glacialis]
MTDTLLGSMPDFSAWLVICRCVFVGFDALDQVFLDQVLCIHPVVSSFQYAQAVLGGALGSPAVCCSYRCCCCWCSFCWWWCCCCCCCCCCCLLLLLFFPIERHPRQKVQNLSTRI